MRVAELSRRSGVPVPTIKFYLREGLLPSGVVTSPNQAHYDEHHLHRLRLIRALIELAQVPLARVRAVLDALDSDTASLHERIGVAHRATIPNRQPTADESARAAATAQVRDLIERRDWTVGPDAPAITMLIDTIAAVRSLGQDHLVGHLDAYADAAEQIADREVAAVSSLTDPHQLAESVVIGTILGERLVAALRLLAHENFSARQIGPASARTGAHTTLRAAETGISHRYGGT